MFQMFVDLNKTLSREDRKEVGALFFVIIISAIMETLGVVSILPFLAVLANPDIVQNNTILHHFYELGHFTTTNNFLYALGVAVMGVIIFSNAFAAYVNWKISLFTHMQAHSLSLRILNIFLFLPYMHFLKRDSMDMAKNILSEVSHVTKNLVISLLQALSRIIVSVFIIAALIAVDPLLALTVSFVLGGSYVLIYFFLRKKVEDIGRVRMESTADRFSHLSEIIKGVKDIRLNSAEDKYIAEFSKSSHATSLSYAQYDIISLMPKYILETIAFSAIILIILYLMQHSHNFMAILPQLGLYALGGQRLLPSLQNIFLNITKIKYGYPALKEVIAELDLGTQTLPRFSGAAMPFDKNIQMDDVTFSYNDDQHIISGLNLTISKGQKVAFVGATGAGKSTVVDLLTGLHFASRGEVSVDGVAITKENVARWQKNIACVPQNVFLFNDSFVNNIALVSDPHQKVDMARVIEAAKLAELHDFIMSETADGYETMIGENGIRLSGGQRQRLGLARAIYADRPVLLLDEATSALDNITEQSIISKLSENDFGKTIIMVAHRLSTVAKCDVIFFLENGKILHQGTYTELLEKSPEFKALAKAAEHT